MTAALLLAASAMPAFAQTAAPGNPLRRPAATAATSAPAVATAAASTETPARQAKRTAKKTPGDFAERRKRCSGEWAAAKAANTTAGQKWPQFFSACNTRLKAAGV